MFRRLFKYYGLFFILLFQYGCADVNDPVPAKDVREIILTDSLNNDSVYTDRASILRAQVSGDILTLIINYTGGCKEHYFEMFIQKGFLESNPVQVRMRLSHDSNDDLCDRIVKDTLNFNLAKLKSYYQTAYQTVHGEILLNIYNPLMQVYTPGPLYSF